MKAISVRVFATGCHSASASMSFGVHEAPVFLPQKIFQQHAQRKRQLAAVADAARSSASRR